jgi:hypothetical protein
MVSVAGPVSLSFRCPFALASMQRFFHLQFQHLLNHLLHQRLQEVLGVAPKSETSS